MNSNKAYKICMAIIIFVITFIMSSTCYADTQRITNDFEISSNSVNLDEVTYGCSEEKNGKTISLLVSAKKYNLPSNLYKYKSDVRLRVTYTENDQNVYDCKVVNYKTGAVIENATDETIQQLFDIEYGKTIKDNTWTDKVKISELTQGTIYKYTADTATQFPEIENDTSKNCLVYIKQKNDDSYENKIYMGKKIASSAASMSSNEYNSGDSFKIMYKELTTSELLKLIKQEEIIYLSKYKNGDKLQYQFEKYIYNDTDKEITVNTKDVVVSGAEDTKTVVIGKGEIYGFDWMIDSATISYIETINNNEQNNQNNQNNQAGGNENTNNQANQTNQQPQNRDGGAEGSNLPKTGISDSIVFIILVVLIVTIIIGRKLRNLNGIE